MHIPLLRIVPDDTKFDFMRFRRISFPISALLSIVAMLLFFFNGLNFGVDFVGGTLMEVQSKTGPADLARMRSTMASLNLGDVQLQQFGAQIYVADLVAIAVVRDMGAMMTGIIMAGRTGAAFAAKLGTMKVTQEIDALITLGFSPLEFLVACP